MTHLPELRRKERCFGQLEFRSTDGWKMFARLETAFSAADDIAAEIARRCNEWQDAQDQIAALDRVNDEQARLLRLLREELDEMRARLASIQRLERILEEHNA